MKPPVFDYHRPTDIDQALALLHEHGDDAKVLAGGQSLIPMMNMRLAAPAVLIDINRITGLDGVEHRNGALAIGSMNRHRALELSEEVRAAQPLLREAAGFISHVTIRNRGTIGGSLVHSDPSAEWATAGLALGAEVVLRSSGGQRRLPLADLLLGPFYTSIEPTELLTEVVVPKQPSRTGSAFLELQRNHGNFAVVSACAVLTLDAAGAVEAATIALGGVAGTPVALPDLAKLVVGRAPDEAAFREVAEAVGSQIDPATDVQATAEYRRQTAGVLVRRALTSAAERATKGAQS
jgi:aerobic carbon-monoxide dehydrogenase medium subunit